MTLISNADKQKNYMNLPESMCSRISWSIAKPILSRHEVPTKKGWQQTIDSLRASNEEDEVRRAIKLYESDYIEHIKYGEKSVRFIQNLETTRERLYEILDGLHPEDHPFTHAYPLIVDEDTLRNLTDYQPHLVDIDHDEHGTSLIYASKRFIELRDRIQDTDIPQEVTDALGQVDELIMVRRSLRQTFDVVWIPTNANYIEIRADHPKNMSCDDAYSTLNRITSTIKATLGITDALDPINLFPLISTFYSNRDEGIVVEMDFITNTASIKREKMRRSGLDLRREIYHQAGYNAVDGNILPYKISLRWERNGNKVSPELSLNSSIRTLHSTQPTLHEAEILWCASFSEYSLITEKIFSYCST